MVYVEDILREIPPVTKILCGGSILVHFLAYTKIVTEYDLFFSTNLIFSHFQVKKM